MVKLFVKRRKVKAKTDNGTEKRPKTAADAIRAGVRLDLFKTRLRIINNFHEIIDLIKAKAEEGDESLASQLWKLDFIGGLGYRGGEKEKLIGQRQQVAFEALMLRLKVAERKWGSRHPWTQVCFEATANAVKGRLYSGVKEKDTETDVALPPELWNQYGGWKGKKADLRT